MARSGVSAMLIDSCRMRPLIEGIAKNELKHTSKGWRRLKDVMVAGSLNQFISSLSTLVDMDTMMITFDGEEKHPVEFNINIRKCSDLLVQLTLQWKFLHLPTSLDSQKHDLKDGFHERVLFVHLVPHEHAGREETIAKMEYLREMNFQQDGVVMEVACGTLSYGQTAAGEEDLVEEQKQEGDEVEEEGMEEEEGKEEDGKRNGWRGWNVGKERTRTWSRRRGGQGQGRH
eukprot:762711-Hanusia_phi.AAC.1